MTASHSTHRRHLGAPRRLLRAGAPAALILCAAVVSASIPAASIPAAPIQAASLQAELPGEREQLLPLPALEAASLGAWREHIRPSPAELAYAGVGWIPSFAAGLRRADADGRPLLFWAMNGHPLGCT